MCTCCVDHFRNCGGEAIPIFFFQEKIKIPKCWTDLQEIWFTGGADLAAQTSPSWSPSWPCLTHLFANLRSFNQIWVFYFFGFFIGVGLLLFIIFVCSQGICSLIFMGEAVCDLWEKSALWCFWPNISAAKHALTFQDISSQPTESGNLEVVVDVWEGRNDSALEMEMLAVSWF